MVLFVEDTVPLRRLGSGFVRSNDIVHAIAAAGYEVHVYPMNGAPYDVMSLFGELPESAEILHDRDALGLAAFLQERKGIYDVIWVARAHNFARDAAACCARRKSIPRACRLFWIREAVAAKRDAARAGLAGQKFDFDAALQRGICRHGNLRENSRGECR